MKFPISTLASERFSGLEHTGGIIAAAQFQNILHPEGDREPPSQSPHIPLLSPWQQAACSRSSRTRLSWLCCVGSHVLCGLCVGEGFQWKETWGPESRSLWGRRDRVSECTGCAVVRGSLRSPLAGQEGCAGRTRQITGLAPFMISKRMKCSE